MDINHERPVTSREPHDAAPDDVPEKGDSAQAPGELPSSSSSSSSSAPSRDVVRKPSRRSRRAPDVTRPLLIMRIRARPKKLAAASSASAPDWSLSAGVAVVLLGFAAAFGTYVTLTQREAVQSRLRQVAGDEKPRTAMRHEPVPSTAPAQDVKQASKVEKPRAADAVAMLDPAASAAASAAGTTVARDTPRQRVLSGTTPSHAASTTGTTVARSAPSQPMIQDATVSHPASSPGTTVAHSAVPQPAMRDATTGQATSSPGVTVAGSAAPPPAMLDTATTHATSSPAVTVARSAAPPPAMLDTTTTHAASSPAVTVARSAAPPPAMHGATTGQAASSPAVSVAHSAARPPAMHDATTSQAASSPGISVAHSAAPPPAMHDTTASQAASSPGVTVARNTSIQPMTSDTTPNQAASVPSQIVAGTPAQPAASPAVPVPSIAKTANKPAGANAVPPSVRQAAKSAPQDTGTASTRTSLTSTTPKDRRPGAKAPKAACGPLKPCDEIDALAERALREPVSPPPMSKVTATTAVLRDPSAGVLPAPARPMTPPPAQASAQTEATLLSAVNKELFRRH